ncbi:MAG: PAS domain S-box protein [Thermodesulfobacteriota bacterium]|nr:PAS domain S-box protein [Thermodesulfobacteriota bacterium]
MQDKRAWGKNTVNLSPQFFNLESDEVDRGIKDVLQNIGETTGSDHGYVYLFSNDKTKMYRTHGWYSDGSPPQKDQLAEWPVEKFPWLMGKLMKGELIHIVRVTDLPPEASSEKEAFQAQGCQSAILIPMVYEKHPIGFMGFETMRAEKTWPEESIGLLRMVGEVFINSLERRRAEKALQSSQEKYRNLVENINDVIFSLDTQGRFTYISPMVEQVASYKVNEMMGKAFADLVYMEDLPEFLKSMRQILAGKATDHEFRIVNKEGSIRHVRISNRRLMEGEQTIGVTGMLSDITERKWAEVLLKRAEEKYRSIFENALEGIFQSTLDGHFIVANPACARILGYASAEELITQNVDIERRYFVDPERYREFQQQLKEKGIVQKFEAEVYRRDGSKIWISLNAVAIRDQNAALQFIEGTIEDITERKWADDQIRYLSFHDKLTGLYNRVYFEEELKRLDTERQLPISLIMGDVNGLKLVNDGFGHQEGDKLLTRIAVILKESCRKEDVIARLGGDEFAIFLPRTSYKVTMEIVERIKMACSQASYDPVQLSIAMGAVTKDDPNQDIQDIFKEAEERMYRSKLLESKSVRASIISSLRRTLFEKSHETEEHTYRIQQLALQLGRAFGLSNSELDDLALLATLHDIGKIAIPEGIIIKPGNLSPEEWEIIWKHPEIGYRIAGSSPELAPIAEAILAHHECWDGSGYPQGLKGKEIPLISRIIAIVDAFDVMTYGRPYKEAKTKEACLRELQAKAGTQFDPVLIDLFVKMVSA